MVKYGIKKEELNIKKISKNAENRMAVYIYIYISCIVF